MFKRLFLLLTVLVFTSSFLPVAAFAETLTPPVIENEAELPPIDHYLEDLPSELEFFTPLVEVFERDDCKHCQDEREFFDDFQLENPDVVVNYYSVYEEEYEALWAELVELEGLNRVTPITLIGDSIIQGFDSAKTTGVVMEGLIEDNRGNKYYSFEEFIAEGGSGNITRVDAGACEEGETCAPDHYEPFLVQVPLFGVVDVKRYSIPVMSLVLGFVDGFNPCAMWVLVTFLIVLVQIGDRKKMWQIAGLFILAEAIMYYLILNVWSGVWDFIGLDKIITPIVGVLAVGGGLFFLYEWYQSGADCKVTNLKQRSKVRGRINKLVAAEMTILTVIGILGLALSVNIIEFACSIGIPQAFTKILDINGFDILQRQFYMGLYILMYMVDDLIVFGIALYSFEKIGLTTKYTKISNLVGGLLMLALGIILILKPELLVL